MPLNIARLTELAEVLETRDKLDGMGFDMDYIYQRWETPAEPKAKHCGTVGCIAGWACVLFDKDSKQNPTEERAQRLLVEDATWQDYDTLHDLFFPPVNANWSSITTKAAAEAVRAAIATGEVDWRAIIDRLEGDDE
jgi:hypothetical protein